MTSVLDLGQVLATITAGLVDEFGAALARIWLVDPSRAQLRLRASSGLSTRLDGSYAMVPFGAFKIGGIAASSEPLCANDIASDPRIANSDWVRAHGLMSFVGYPLRFRGELLGVLGMFGSERISPSEFERVGVFAHQAAIAIKNARLFAELEHVAQRLRAENVALQEEVKDERQFAEIVGESASLRALLTEIERVAPTDATVLIHGETGTGKELIAREIHRRSNRRSGALIKLNCAAVAPTLIESELFGHERGAFTGATQRRVGRFELAHEGTLFLDEAANWAARTASQAAAGVAGA